jgi:Pyruvate/2-oxoacid:ferredoxin oxidoreductase delta subunit
MKASRIIFALLVGSALGVSCDAPTFYCLDDLVVGDGEWTCQCKFDPRPCADVGVCIQECPAQ